MRMNMTTIRDVIDDFVTVLNMDYSHQHLPVRIRKNITNERFKVAIVLDSTDKSIKKTYQCSIMEAEIICDAINHLNEKELMAGFGEIFKKKVNA